MWQKYFPHLSPKEAHAELMQMFPEAEEEWNEGEKDEWIDYWHNWDGYALRTWKSPLPRPTP